MTEKKSLILDIQENCLDSNVPVVQILRKAKVVAAKLELEDFLKWLNDELDGYTCDEEELPPYRVSTGEPKAFNTYHGWRTIQFTNPDHAKMISTATIKQPIGPMEKMMLSQQAGSILIFPYSPEQKTQLSSWLNHPADVRLEVAVGAIIGIIDKVRNILLDWTLKLEKSGVIGEGLSFNKEDKVEATTVTQNFYAENIAVTGQVHDQANVTNIQNTYHLPLSIQDVVSFTNQTRGVISHLPDEIQGDVQKYTEQIVEEAKKEKPEHSLIKSLLTSLRTV